MAGLLAVTAPKLQVTVLFMWPLQDVVVGVSGAIFPNNCSCGPYRMWLWAGSGAIFPNPRVLNLPLGSWSAE